MTSKPISIAEVKRQKQQKVDDIVIDALNRLLVIKWDGSEAMIEQRALAEEMNIDRSDKDYQPAVNAHCLEAYSMMDGIEELYATENWAVQFIQPTGKENEKWFEPYYRFTIKPGPSPLVY